MNIVKIKLDSIDKVKGFVHKVAVIDSDLDLVSERYTINAKSIMGIFSLDLSKELQLVIHIESEVEAVKTALKDYLV